MTMKFLALPALLAISGCVLADRPPPFDAPSAPDPESRAMVDRLRVDPPWHPPTGGGQGLSCSYELPEGAYVAQGWPCSFYRLCGWERPWRWSRSCRPLPPCPEW
jgi:hypothetical protein